MDGNSNLPSLSKGIPTQQSTGCCAMKARTADELKRYAAKHGEEKSK